MQSHPEVLEVSTSTAELGGGGGGRGGHNSSESTILPGGTKPQTLILPLILIVKRPLKDLTYQEGKYSSKCFKIYHTVTE